MRTHFVKTIRIAVSCVRENKQTLASQNAESIILLSNKIIKVRVYHEPKSNIEIYKRSRLVFNFAASLRNLIVPEFICVAFNVQMEH